MEPALERQYADRLHQELLDRLPFGLLVVDAAGRVLTLNRAAERMAAAGDGIVLRCGRLSAARHHEAAHLAELVADAAAAGRGGALRVSRPPGRTAYGVQVAPLTPATARGPGSSPPACMVAITDPDAQAAIPARRLAELFGLTPAECRLAQALAAGKSLQEYAAEAGVAPQTARWRLKRVFAKTETTRQADLIRLLLASAVPG